MIKKTRSEYCVKWEPVTGIDYPCADISFKYDAPFELAVTMNFSRVKGLQPKDLLIKFDGPISFRWEDEVFGLNYLPEDLPRCSNPEWKGWTFPLLRVENSLWLKRHHDRNSVYEDRVHFALLSMNDLIQVLALPVVEVQWIKVEEE